ncbi:PEP-CTERM sorting domain-containing protein [Luteolibacter marinus]|uniref:PEP-CTERM sorting domain-containing protein n=1 Tax=Luteolibacter marinus TaxID=2776705 RepID=UPI00186947DE|nr:PEP-CTERM sorting domain-containing protein [Luteolibacter marinus]
MKALTCLFALGMLTVSASAAQIVYVWEGSLSGSLGGSSFTSESFVLTVTADTVNIAPYSDGVFVPNDTATIDLLGQTLTITTPTTTNLNDTFDGVTFGNDLVQFDILLMFNGALDGYDLASPFGPLVVAPPDTFVSQAGNPLATSGGALLISDSAGTTLTFSAIPEPTTLALLGLGGLTLGRRRSR